MTILEYAKKELEKLKDQPPKKRLEYIWEYYKIHLIVVVLVLVLLVQGIVSICTQKDTVLSGVLINSSLDTDSKPFMADLADHMAVNEKKEQISFSTNIFMTNESADKAVALQSIMASVTIRELDMVTGPEEAFQICAYNASNMFADLRDHLDADTLAKLSGRLYYIDGAVLEKLNAPVGTQVDMSQLVCPDPKKPDAMEKPIPVGIDVSDTEFVSAYFSQKDVYYFGMITNTTRPETVIKFIDYLFS